MKIIAVIDDQMSEIISEIVSEGGYIIKTFSDPLVAIEQLKDNLPDFIVTDYEMPGMNGEQVLDILNIQGIILTGNHELKSKYPILNKPFKQEQLLDCIKI